MNQLDDIFYSDIESKLWLARYELTNNFIKGKMAQLKRSISNQLNSQLEYAIMTDSYFLDEVEQ